MGSSFIVEKYFKTVDCKLQLELLLKTKVGILLDCFIYKH
jgi:hypothetical protein